MEMKVWVCETWETDGYETWGESISIWHSEETAREYGQSVVGSATGAYWHKNYQVWEELVQ